MSIKRGKIGQVSFEYALTVAFVLTILLGGGFYFLQHINSTNSDVEAVRANSLAESILSSVKDAASSSGYFKETIYVKAPGTIHSMKTEGGVFVFEMDSSSGTGTLVYPSDIVFGTNIDPESIQGGVFTIEKLNDVIIVCTGTKCKCKNVLEDDIVSCDDGLDNDCDGYLDREDCDCVDDLGLDGDGDGYSAISCNGRPADCDDSNAAVQLC